MTDQRILLHFDQNKNFLQHGSSIRNIVRKTSNVSNLQKIISDIFKTLKVLCRDNYGSLFTEAPMPLILRKSYLKFKITYF